MRLRFLLVIALATILLPAGFARAGVATGGSVQQYGGFSFQQNIPGGTRSASVAVVASYGETSTGPTVTPVIAFEASGYMWECAPGCTYVGYPVQAVNPTALSMDPAGNSVRLTFTLSLASPPLTIDVTMTRPQTLLVAPSTGQPNAWVDPSSGAARAELNYSGIFLQRMGYTVVGTAQGISVASPYTSGWGGMNVFTQTIAVSAP